MGEEEGSQIEIPVCPKCGRMRTSDEFGGAWKKLTSKELEVLIAGYQQIQFQPQACPQCAEEIWRVKMQP